MTKPIEKAQVSQTYTQALTNFWRDEKNIVKKIIKLFAAIIGYFFALPLDLATKVGNYFVKEEKPQKKNLLSKIKKHASDLSESLQKFVKTPLGKTALASTALVGLGLLGHHFNLHNKMITKIRSFF